MTTQEYEVRQNLSSLQAALIYLGQWMGDRPAAVQAAAKYIVEEKTLLEQKLAEFRNG